MTDTATPDIVEISPNEPGVNPLSSEGPAPEAGKPEAKADGKEGKAEKPSIEDSIKKAFEASREKEAAKANAKDAQKDAAKDAPKADAQKAELKAKETTDAADAARKPADPQPVSEKARGEQRPSEGRRYDSPPSRFLPEATVKWANVPNEIKSEVHRVFEEFDREKKTMQEHVKFREELREYEELGRQNNTTIKEALGNYVAMERALKENPTQGFQRLLSNMGIDPQQAISHILQAYNVSPQTLARHIAEHPQMYAPQQRQVAPQQQMQAPPQVMALEQKLSQLEQKLAEKEQMEVVGKVMPIIEDFASQHPDYWNLEEAIAEILKSGIIERIHGNGLQPKQRLSEAYRMAGGRGPSSRSGLEEQADGHPAPTRRPVNPDAGKLSIGGAPAAGDVKSTSPRKKAPVSIEEALANAIRRAS